jgi:signal transduction histidine kinase/CheY-like chemotaxis protein
MSVDSAAYEADIFRAFFAYAPQAAFIVSCDGEILHCNAHAAAMLGKTCADLEHGAAWLRPDNAQAWQDLCGVALGTDHSHRNEFILANGTPVHLHCVALRNAAKRPQALACLLEDRRAAMQQNQALHTCQQALADARQVWTDSPLTVFEWQAQSGWPVLAVSDNIVALSGYQAEEFLSGRIPFAALISPDDFNYLASALENAAQNGDSHLPAHVYQIVHKSGQLRRVLTYIRLKRDNNSYIYAYSAYLLDISALEITPPDNNAQVDPVHSRFLADMSHELRTPLNSILGFTQILLADPALADGHKNAVNNIHQSGSHLLELIGDILDLAKIEAGKMSIRPQPCLLYDLLQGLADSMRVRAELKDLMFVQDFDAALPHCVLADSTRLRQTLINLIGNALKFTRHGQITFKVFKQGDKIAFVVSDTGEGIDHANIESIFEPFRQVGSHRQEGSGLGLAISRHLVQLMGGALNVHSEPGLGSTFSFELKFPLARIEESADLNRQVIGYQGPRRTVLVVEDERLNRTILVNSLKNIGFHIKEAVNGEQALKLAGLHMPDVILMDIFMPDMDGLETTASLRQLPGGAQVPVIAVSASVFEQHRANSLAAGCNDFLAKPVNLDELRDKLATWLQLEWIYRDLEESVLPISSDGPALLPSPAQLQHLLSLAVRGDISTLSLEVAAMLRESPQYLNFAREVLHLADTFELRKLQAYIESCMTPTESLPSPSSEQPSDKPL